MSGFDVDVPPIRWPEFGKSSLEQCFAIVPLNEARAISRAAMLAHFENHPEAERARYDANYGGLENNQPED